MIPASIKDDLVISDLISWEEGLHVIDYYGKLGIQSKTGKEKCFIIVNDSCGYIHTLSLIFPNKKSAK